MTYIALTGRLAEISIAELEALYGAHAVTRLGDHALVDSEVDFSRLGGTIKLARLITVLNSTKPQKAFDYCRKALPGFIADVPEGKIKLGVSLYGTTMPLAKHNANVLSLKKVIRQAGRSVRAVPNTEPALSSAQTYHNSLASPVGLELVFVVHDGQTFIGRVTQVQDIDSYTLRDRGRPKRDAFVGMLPPKLAQTIINLAALADSSSPIASSTSPIADDEQPERSDSSIEARPAANTASENSRVEEMGPKSQTVFLDPFCGTGVILQEAALMGYSVYGSDISEKMVRFSRDNLNWAMETFHLSTERQLEIGDATTHTWRQPINAVACEGYLGRPIGGQTVSQEQLAEIMHECNTIMRGFLRNIATQLEPGTGFCIAAPAWQYNGTLHDLPVIDELAELGFERVNFTHVDSTKLLYSRDDQATARRLLVIRRV
jgi:tRNA G10  N-methylase Trm11